MLILLFVVVVVNIIKYIQWYLRDLIIIKIMLIIINIRLEIV